MKIQKQIRVVEIASPFLTLLNMSKRGIWQCFAHKINAIVFSGFVDYALASAIFDVRVLNVTKFGEILRSTKIRRASGTFSNMYTCTSLL